MQSREREREREIGKVGQDQGECIRLYSAARPQYKHTYTHTQKQTDVCVCAHIYSCNPTSLILQALRSLNKNKCPIHPPHITEAQQEHCAELKSFGSY